MIYNSMPMRIGFVCAHSTAFPCGSKEIERNEDPLVGTFSMVQFPPTVMVAYAANCKPRTAALSPRYCQTGGVWDPLDPLYKRPPHGGIVTTEAFLTVWDWTIMTPLGTGVLLPCLLLSEPSIFIYTRISIVMFVQYTPGPHRPNDGEHARPMHMI